MEHKLYGLPSLNDKLYLHYKGFSRIQNLDEYTSLRALWLEGNGLVKIEGLDSLTELRTLFLHENAIDAIEGLEKLTYLDNVNLSKNYIRKVENLSNNQKLTGINLANNMLTTRESIEGLLEIPGLQTIDVQHNRINDSSVVELFQQFSDLRVLYLQGNPVVKIIPYYRKTIISKCKSLKYLDDRPVFDEERRRVDAWAAAFEVGGIDAANLAEREEIKKIREEKNAADDRNMAAFEQMMREGLEIRRTREITRKGESETESNSKLMKEIADGEKDGLNPFSGEAIVHVSETAGLREIRENRLRSFKENLDTNSVSSLILTGDQSETNATHDVCSEGGNTSTLSLGPIQGSVWSKLQIQCDEDDENVNESVDTTKVSSDIESTDNVESRLNTSIHGSTLEPESNKCSESSKSKFMDLLTKSSEEVASECILSTTSTDYDALD